MNILDKIKQNNNNTLYENASDDAIRKLASDIEALIDIGHDDSENWDPPLGSEMNDLVIGRLAGKYNLSEESIDKLEYKSIDDYMDLGTNIQSEVIKSLPKLISNSKYWKAYMIKMEKRVQEIRDEEGV